MIHPALAMADRQYMCWHSLANLEAQLLSVWQAPKKDG
jgi:hypothetical protein